ncbi:MAG: 2-oxoacid:acceptor oxidoreductase family protein [bacterium]|nr:2-oxoacid:acceptor oxidoreductase family protein [bacterium]
MTYAKKLPVTNDTGYYEIRLESIGGLGANLCGKMLGELGLRHLHVNSASFSSYGSEKTGTPVTAYIRYCDFNKEIRIHSPIIHPHLLCIFHEALLSDTHVLRGCTKDTVIVLHTADAAMRADRLRSLLAHTDFHALYTIPAQEIAIETHSRINVVLLGAMANVMGFVPLEAAEKICLETLGQKYPDALAANLAGLRKGYEMVSQYFPVSNAIPSQDGAAETDGAGCCPGGRQLTGSTDGRSNVGQASADTDGAASRAMPIGGLNPHFGNSVTNDLSPSRQGYLPLFIKERCINCGLCDSACPDMVFQFEKGTYRGREMMVNRGLDYYHCKGCLRCVAVCPTQALVKGLEAEHPHKEWFLPNQELLRTPDYYEKTGADGYITSESYLTEQRLTSGPSAEIENRHTIQEKSGPV